MDLWLEEAVVFVHGGLGAHALADEFRWISYDLRFYGRSSGAAESGRRSTTRSPSSTGSGVHARLRAPVSATYVRRRS